MNAAHAYSKVCGAEFFKMLARGFTCFLPKKIRSKVRKWIEITTYSQVVTLNPRKKPVGRALLSYLLEPFLMKDSGKSLSGHTNLAESILIAETLMDLGYTVDVIDFTNKSFVPKKPYNLLISARTNFQRYSALVGENCVKVVHLDVSHWLYNNSTAIGRCYEVLRKRGVALSSYREIEENWAIEHADFATMLGNRFSTNTYAYAGKAIHALPVPILTTWPEPRKDFEAARRSFLWFGSRGFIHKGLDLVLDAFSRMPEYNLYVCGPLKRDPEFTKAYSRELYETPNIHAIGWIDVASQEFVDLANKVTGLVYPSCAEGQSGAVLTCMGAGIIPIVSNESGVDLPPNCGMLLSALSVQGIIDAVSEISRQPSGDLAEMTRNAWSYVRENHSREKYLTSFKHALKVATAEGSIRRTQPDFQKFPAPGKTSADTG